MNHPHFHVRFPVAVERSHIAPVSLFPLAFAGYPIQRIIVRINRFSASDHFGHQVPSEIVCRFIAFFAIAE